MNEAYLEASHKAQRRALRRQVVGPVVLCVMVVGLVPLFLALAIGGERLNVVAALMSLAITGPLTILCFIPYVVLLAATFGLAKAYSKVTAVMTALHRGAHAANIGIRSLSRRIAGPVIEISVRVAGLQRALGSTPPSALPDEDEED